MKSYTLEYLQSILAYAPTLEEIRPQLEDAGFRILTGSWEQSLLDLLSMWARN